MDKQYTLVFNAEQLVAIDKAIQQMPYYIAAPLIAEINKQIAKQETKDKE